jgi:hypothetical protein
VGVLVVISAGFGIYMFVRRRRVEAAIEKDPMAGFSPAMAYAPPLQLPPQLHSKSGATYPSTYDLDPPPQYPGHRYPFVGFGAVSTTLLLKVHCKVFAFVLWRLLCFLGIALTAAV